MEDQKESNLGIVGETMSFSDFPEDVQLCILSFLTPSDISTFACTSKRFVALCRSDSNLWFSMCDRRWGSKTQIRKWGNGRIGYKRLYKTLIEYESLIGFWRRSGQAAAGILSPSLVFFEWGPSFITGSRVSPSKNGTYQVKKSPFLWMSLSSDGEALNYVDPDSELIHVSVSFMGKNHVVVEENQSSHYSCLPEMRKIGLQRSGGYVNMQANGADTTSRATGSPENFNDQLMSEMYQYFANWTSPGSDRAWRRQRKREKGVHGRRKWEPEHFVKIVNCSPTPSRPLQGLWKGICDDDVSLDFYLVAYDDIGGIACRRVGDSSQPFSSYSPVFWTSSTTFIESPLSPEEVYLYDSRVHLRPLSAANCIHNESNPTEDEPVKRVLHISSSYDLVIPDLAGNSGNPRNAEGRIWQYEDGTFGFGFLRNNFIIDLKHIAYDGCLLDTMEPC